MVLPLHGWEYLLLWSWLDRRLGTRWALPTAYGLHLLLDQLWNEKRSRRIYLLGWRARYGFAADQLGPVDPVRRHKWRGSSFFGLIRWF